ncbi:MAG: hypothetical protein V4582_18085 [Pseudomonadota bacterium]
MSIFESEIESFIRAIDDERSWVDEFSEHSRKMSALYAEASVAEIDDALHRFSSRLPDLPLVALGQVSITCGSLVEYGGDPEIAGPALIEWLTRVNEGVTDFCQRCRALAESDNEFIAKLRPMAAENAGEGIDAGSLTPAEIIADHINNEGWKDLARRFGPDLFKVYPTSVLCHMGNENFRLGLISHLSRSTKLRRVAREQTQYLEGTRLADEAEGLDQSFLKIMLQVLEDEQLLVLHVEQGKGFEVRISGIADNFQLHTLLAGAIIGSPSGGMVAGEAPSKLAVAQCRDTAVGDGGGENVTGAFNLWNWDGIGTDGSLPSGTANSHHWIWGEGCPADIRPFEERRVVLLGHPPYKRQWVAGRSFSGMVGAMTVERLLSDVEVGNWLNRLAQAAHPAVPSADVEVSTDSPVNAAPRVKSWWRFF